MQGKDCDVRSPDDDIPANDRQLQDISSKDMGEDMEDTAMDQAMITDLDPPPESPVVLGGGDRSDLKQQSPAGNTW